MVERIFLATAGYYPDSIGGAARQANILAETLGGLGVDVTLIAPTTSRDVAQVENTGFGRIERFFDRAYPNEGGRHIASFVRWTQWFRHKYRGRITRHTPVYVFHARLHALAPALAAREAGAPLVIKLGGGGEASDFAALRAKRYCYGRWVQSYLLKNVDAFVANGAQIELDLRRLGVEPDRIAAFPNGVVLPRADELTKAAGSRSGTTFIFAGRLVPDKRLQVLVEAAADVHREHAELKLVLLGDGPERTRLDALSRATNFQGALSLPGYAADVYPELWKADFFVSASKREGQSNALLEAMSAGLIPIIFGASGAADVVEHGRTGFIVKKSKPEHFSAAMQWALALSPQKRLAMSLAARQFAEDHIGIEAVARQTVTLFQSLSQTAECSLAAPANRKGMLPDVIAAGSGSR